MAGILANTERRALVANTDRRALVDASCAEECCGGDPCPNWVRAAWCCNPGVFGWLYMNRPECPGYVPDRTTIRADASQVVSIFGTCYATDPDTVRAGRDIPDGEPIINVGPGLEIAPEGCSDPLCRECPSCCAAQVAANGTCGFPGNPSETHCCVCGESYVLTITSRETSTIMATYGHPCTPRIDPQGPIVYQECEASGTYVFEFVCDRSSDAAIRVVNRIQGTLERTTRKHWARIDIAPEGPGQQPPCSLDSFSAGRVDTEVNTFGSGQAWVLGEGCGLLRQGVSQYAAGGCAYGSNVAAMFDAGQCSGHYRYDADCNDPFILNNLACVWGLQPFEDTTWSGDQRCDGGFFTSNGTLRTFFANDLRAEVSVGGQPRYDETGWGGVKEISWEQSLSWSVSGGGDCFGTNPCQNQSPQLRSNRIIKVADRAVGAPKVRTSGGLLERALGGARGKGCSGCGR